MALSLLHSMISLITMMLSIVDLFFFPAVCISDALLCIHLFRIFFTISYALNTIFVMSIPFLLCWFFTFGPLPLYNDSIAVSLHCNGVCLSSKTLLNIAVRLISSHLLLFFTYSAFHMDLQICYFPYCGAVFSPPFVSFFSFSFRFVYDFMFFQYLFFVFYFSPFTVYCKVWKFVLCFHIPLYLLY